MISSASTSNLLPSGGGAGKRKQKVSRLKERANMSFFIVVMFFAVFGVIVLTEIFLIDERGKGVNMRHGSVASHRKDRLDYEDQDDYLYRGPEDAFGMMMRGRLGNTPNVGVHLPPALGADIGVLPAGHALAPDTEKELPALPSNTTPTDGMWRSVGNTRYKFYVYSAYFDRRDKQHVRVIAATKTRGPERVWCRMYYAAPMPHGAANVTGNTTYTSMTVLAKIKVIRENWNLKYSACFVLCPLKTAPGAPQAVSVVSKLRAPPSHMLHVRNTDQDFGNRTPQHITDQIPERMAVCIKPFHFYYDQSINLLEFLELYSTMGVDHFFMYQHTLGPHTSCILKHYEAKGMLTMLPWHLNMLSQKEIRTENQFAAFNDCLYRSMYRYSHVAFVDLDEFIVPRHNYTLPEMIRWLGARLNVRNTGSYSFQNAFFYLQWDDDPTVFETTDKIEAGLLTMRKTRRRAKLHPHKQRSKYICRPELVIEAGNHFVWEFVPGHGTLNVPPDTAILNHYRVCEFGGNDCVKTASSVDRTAYKYKPELVDRVRQKYEELRDTCRLPELQPLPTVRPTPKKRTLMIKPKMKLKPAQPASYIAEKYVQIIKK